MKLNLPKIIRQFVPESIFGKLASGKLSRIRNPGTTATEAEARKIEKYRELIDNGYIFPPVALEVQGSSGERSEICITSLCKNAKRS